MTYTFRPAFREDVTLLVGLAGGTGSGKTMSAMRMATGIVGRDKRFAVLDTEAGRALHYAPRRGEQPDFKSTFHFDYCELKAPFRPSAYADALATMDAGGYGAIVVDSFSHSHDGEGGVLDWQAEELANMVKQAQQRGRDQPEWKLIDSYKRSAWIVPKAGYRKMVNRLLQMRAHLIICLRAEDKIDFVKDGDGKTKVVPMETLSGYKGWIPICDKKFPFELTASFVLLPNEPGVPQPIKLQEQHIPIFPKDKVIDEETGKRLAAWASATATPKQTVASAGITDAEWNRIGSIARKASHEPDTVKAWLLNHYGASNAETLKRSDYGDICNRLVDPAPLDPVSPPPDDARE